MRPKSLALALAVVAPAAGCTLNRDGSQPDAPSAVARATSMIGRFAGGGGGRVIEPDRCTLRVAILPRPVGDKAVNEAVWGAADEQAVPAEARRALGANGLRLGLITGDLPAPLAAALEAPPPHKVEPSTYSLPSGDGSLISLSEAAPTVSLLYNRDGRPFGKDYQDASGWVRVTATHEGADGVALRLVPEIHHGPVLRRFDTLPTPANGLNSKQFRMKDGQAEETLRDLAAGLTLRPGQVAVLGSDPARRGNLGAFLFTETEANSDRLTQKIVLIWATRASSSAPASRAEPGPERLVPDDPPDPLDHPGRKAEGTAGNPG